MNAPAAQVVSSLGAKQGAALPSNLHNKLGTPSFARLRASEGPIVEGRLRELKLDPVEPTFDLKHITEINRRLLPNVYQDAGKLSDRYREMYVEGMLKEVRESFTDTRGKESLVYAMAEGVARLDKHYLFRDARRATNEVFLGQLANTREYEVDFKRLNAKGWNTTLDAVQIDRDEHDRIAMMQPDSDEAPEPYIANLMPVRAMIRSVTQTSQAAAFTDWVKYQEDRILLARYPDLEPVIYRLQGIESTLRFKYRDYRDALSDREGEGVRQAVKVKNEMEKYYGRTERWLNGEMTPQKTWNNAIGKLLAHDHTMDR